MGVDQKGLFFISICSRIKSINKVNDYLRMTNPKGMHEFFGGREFEDVHDWVECLEMAIEVRGIDELKSKEWFKKLIATPMNRQAMKVAMLLKYGTIDKE